MQRLCHRLVTLPLLLVVASATAGEDAAGCHDNPLFTRMPSYYIAGCESSEFDAVEMPVGLDADGNPLHTSLEGAVSYVTYGIRDGARVASPLQILRNHLQAAKAGGATVVKEFGARTGMLTDGWVNIQERMATLKLQKNGREFWVHLGSVNSGDYYAIGMVEVQAMKQDVASNELLDRMEKDGFITLHVNFDTNKATIKPDSAAALDQAASALALAPKLQIEVGGHTDNVGTPQANQKLSQARAQAVARALAERGVAAGRMSARGYGQSVPIADNRSEDGRARNRRVELRKIGAAAAAAPAAAPAAAQVAAPPAMPHGRLGKFAGERTGNAGNAVTDETGNKIDDTVRGGVRKVLDRLF